ncbi:hypothetical protein L602_000800000230 [Cupriavidus gilardii J11]|uniref:Uncharacterized protein n=1 Tax=Cupriavidus gilardii J11 TaxID=936133 RepID=A0A562B1L1_9BURK|nr:hypothetical protein [Cupriavidus gilardii]TWG78954.1 hypothetical protein L602_000800000230 [Cupriavidus gilardii J11]
MSKLLSSTAVVILLAAVFLIAGLVYEASYFSALGLSALSTLGVRHYIYSGFMVTVVPAIMLVGFALLKKFFSKHVDRNDSAAFVQAAKDIGFAQSLSMARFVLLLCVAVWIFAIFEDRLFESPYAWSVVPWLSLFVLEVFFFAVYTSPPHSRPAITFAFAVAICFCISVWAIGSARLNKDTRSVPSQYIRDDAIVRIARTGGGYDAEAKPLKLPLPLLEKLARAIFDDPK